MLIAQKFYLEWAYLMQKQPLKRALWDVPQIFDMWSVL
jgi:hypothetical protein